MPAASLAAAEAPACSSACTIGTSPRAAAIWIAAVPFFDVRVSLPPFFVRRRIMSTLPERAAKCTGGQPSRSRAFGSAPTHHRALCHCDV